MKGPPSSPEAAAAEAVFAEPWQAQAFALTLQLHRAGHFGWPEWSARLAAEIARAGAPDSGEHYYLHWLNALETLIRDKGLSDAAELQRRKQAWDRAARDTPHGQPIRLGGDPA